MKIMKAAQRALEIRYAIRDVVLPARELEKQGIEVIKMNIGDPVAYDFDVPEEIKTACAEAIMEGYNGYTASEGIPALRDAIVEKEKKDGVAVAPSDIVVTTGVTEALQILFAAALEGGDEILVPGPTYPPYITYARMLGANPVSYRTVEEEGWQPDVNDLRQKITRKTKAIAVINPNNPTGALYGKKVLKEIASLAHEHDLFIISDEIYDGMVYEEKAVSIAALDPDVPVVILNGISKIYLAPGWRIGYMAFRDSPDGRLSEIKTAVLNQARARLCANSICQYGYLKALVGDQGHIRDTTARLRLRRDFAHERINEIQGLRSIRPGGAFYMFPRIEFPVDDRQFVLDVLHNCHILFVHGSGFCPRYGKGHFRLVFLPPVEVMETAFDRLEKYCSGL